ncbi:MAG: hypothetical protein WA996_19040 [Candidatus Promineifilaceae bacterium]
MEITRNVIIDLLPLYMAGEVSEDSRLLVEKYLRTDPELAAIASQPMTVELADDIPVSLNEEDKMEAYKEAKRLMFWRTIIVAVVIAFLVLALLAFAGVVWLFLIPA